MVRLALFVLTVLSVSACGAASDGGDAPSPAEPVGDTAAAPVEAAEPSGDAGEVPLDESTEKSATSVAAVVAEATDVKNLDTAGIPLSPFNPEEPEGVLFYAIAGDPKEGAFSAVVELPPGYTAGLHTHKSAYTGIALTDGMAHGDSENAHTVLSAGSSWRQPAGEPHVDGCRSESPCRFLVFFDGPVDMTPAKAPLDDPKARLTMAESRVWSEVKGGVKMSAVRGNPKEGPFVALFDFPAGMATNVHTHTPSFVGALVSGTNHRGPGPDQLVKLNAGSIWSEPAGSPHMEKCGEESNCIIVAAMTGALDTNAVELTPAAAPETGGE